MDSLQIVCIDCGEPVEAGKNRCAMHLGRTPDRAVVDDDAMKDKIRKHIQQLEDENDYDSLMPPPRAVVDGKVSLSPEQLQAVAIWMRMNADEFEDDGEREYGDILAEGWLKHWTEVAKPEPRALVALSDDRQWLVVLMPDAFFEVFQLEDSKWAYGYLPHDRIKDTGQSAHAVLAAWLASRGGE